MTRIGFRLALAYRSNIIMTCVTLVAQVFLLRMIWTSVYGSRPSAAGLSLEALLAYLTLANLQGFATHTLVSRIMHQRIRTGMVFFDLARPVGYLRQMAAFQVGNTAGGLLLLAPVIPVVLLVGSITVPVNGFGYVLTLVLGYVIAVQLALLISLIGFWTMETGAISLLYRLVSQFFAGTMVPLAFFPGFLGVLAEILPFKYMGYVPAAIYVGHITDISGPVLVELAWVAGLWGLLALTWSRAHRRVVIQGG
ncbi:ABC-2 family transporter protein [Nonomuraea sp. NPDC049695]|uniref:ABC transporter permease n=1 Tax=Nonomuraea sp. NPDC049695 TaxID=3154734 RepID=UPI00342F88C9